MKPRNKSHCSRNFSPRLEYLLNCADDLSNLPASDKRLMDSWYNLNSQEVIAFTEHLRGIENAHNQSYDVIIRGIN